MKTTHTPGPWKVAHNGIDIINHGTMQICACNWADPGDAFEPSEDDAMANARLIASSPELLEALQSLLSLAEAMQNRMNANGMEVDFLEEEFALAKEAIAKATGEAKP